MIETTTMLMTFTTMAMADKQ